MEAYNAFNFRRRNFSEKSSSTTLNFSSQFSNSKQPKDLKEYSPSSSFRSSLHSVRTKPEFKTWKKPIAPFPPTPRKVYKVDPVDFRDLVQKLTGDLHHPIQTDLQTLAPPPLPPPPFDDHAAAYAGPLDILSSSSVETTLSTLHQELMSETTEETASNTSFEMNLSPSSYSWFSFPLLSPGTLSSFSLEQ